MTTARLGEHRGFCRELPQRQEPFFALATEKPPHRTSGQLPAQIGAFTETVETLLATAYDAWAILWAAETCPGLNKELATVHWCRHAPELVLARHHLIGCLRHNVVDIDRRFSAPSSGRPPSR